MTQTSPDGFVDIAGNPRPDNARIIWYDGTKGLRLRACVAGATTDTPRGTCLVCPGRSEFIEKYFEVARELQDRGFAVVIFDWPGQGLSDRLLKDPLKGHIDRFDTFVQALDSGVAAAGDLPRPLVSLAHSMGGAISLAALCSGRLKVAAAAFCAPMWGLPVPLALRGVIATMLLAGKSGAFARKPGPPETFDANEVTHDRPHWDMNRQLTDAVPELRLGPPTWGWIAASLKTLDRITRPKALAGITIPVFVASAAEEKLVANSAHATVAAHLSDCEHLTVAGAMHEILMEKPDKRTQFWAGFDRLLTRAGI